MDSNLILEAVTGINLGIDSGGIVFSEIRGLKMSEAERAAVRRSKESAQPTKTKAQQQTSALAGLRGAGTIVGGPLIMISASIAAVTAGLIATRRGRLTPNRIAIAALGAAFPWVYELVLSPWQLNWGSSQSELHRKWPGDDLILNPIYESTHAVTINAAASRVWPWLLQIGQNRGGFFSYDWLENLAGADIHTINHIVPELQRIETGDLVLLAPNIGLVVWEVIPEHALVLRAMDPNTGKAVSPDINANFFTDSTWTFIIDERGEGVTRLIARFRMDGNPRVVLKEAIHYLLETPHFIMQRKMLLGIKRLAEQMNQ